MKSITIDPNTFDGESFAAEYSISEDDFWIEDGNTLKYPDTLPDTPNLGISLSLLKTRKIVAIDSNTRSLIAAGFTYDSQTFSLSTNAQANWNNLHNQESEFTWPLDVSTIDHDEYSLIQANLHAFWTAAKDALNGHLDSGRALKKSIFDAADEAAVDAVVDTR